MNYFKKGRKCAVPNAGRRKDPNSKAGQLRAKKEQEARAIEEKAFQEFLNAENGFFNGFEFVNVFHERISKNNALIIGESDDCAKCEGVSVGADSVTCYFYCEPKNAKKFVSFNRSIYIF